MRIRQVKPSFWSDARLSELPETTRLFYIGLWMVADDAGWFRWEPSEIGLELYGYDDRKKRERRVVEMFAGLVAAGRVIEHSCGHAEIPRMPDHQHLAGNTKQVRTAFNEHLKRCVTSKPEAPQSPANDAVKPDSPQSPANARSGKVRLGNGQVSNGQVRSGNERASANVNGGEPGGIKEVLGQFEDLLTPPAAKS